MVEGQAADADRRAFGTADALVRAELCALTGGVPVLLEDPAGETDLLPWPWPTTPSVGVVGDEGGMLCGMLCGLESGGARAAADCRGA